MTTFACLAAFFGASMCWGVIGYVLGYKRGFAKGYRAGQRPALAALFHAFIDGPCDCPNCIEPDPDAALDAEIEGSK